MNKPRSAKLPKRQKSVAKTEPTPAVERVEVTIESMTADMRPPDAERFRAVWDRYERMPSPLLSEMSLTSEKRWSIRYPGTDAHKAAAFLRRYAALGTRSDAVVDTILGKLMSIWQGDGGVTAHRYDAAIAILEAAQPENELEGMLVVQMIAANDAALRATALFTKSETVEQIAAGANLANKFMRTYVAQMEALTKLRRGGEQIVKYVHVHEGGQAVVAGTINQGGRENFGNAEQPRGAEMPPHRGSLSGPDPARDGVPISGDAEREMSHSRREESGGAEGE